MRQTLLNALGYVGRQRHMGTHSHKGVCGHTAPQACSLAFVYVHSCTPVYAVLMHHNQRALLLRDPGDRGVTAQNEPYLSAQTPLPCHVRR